MHQPGLTVAQTLAEAERRWPDRPALILGGRKASYSELAAQARHLARGLIGLGIGRGDKVGTLMHNCWESVVLFYAASLIGAVLVPFNARYRTDELGFVLAFSDVAALFVTPHGREHADLRKLVVETFPELASWRAGAPLDVAAAPSLRWVADLGPAEGESWVSTTRLAAAAATVSDAALRQLMAEVAGDDICVIMFSSGTTQRPKACMLSHATIALTGRALAQRFELNADDCIWDPLPFYHMSTILPLSACRTAGAAFLAVEHFEPGRALQEIADNGVTILYPAFPTLMASMLAHPDFERLKPTKARLMLNIGAPDLLRRFAAALPNAVQVACYGLTEGGGVNCYSEPGDSLDQRVMTSGTPIDGTELRIVDPATLREVPAGEPGEIWVRGVCVFSGYYKDPELTRQVITPDGWLRTNDIGTVDAGGRLTYRGRLKDMLKIGGENVAAVEIESYLMRHPAVKMAQVVSVPDERLVEVAAAFVELLPGHAASEEELAAFCVGQIASFKVPRYVRIVGEWPMSATKIQKFKLLDGFRADRRIDVNALKAQRP